MQGPGNLAEHTSSQLQRENAELRRRIAELQESERRFFATFEQGVIGIAHVGLDGKWLRVNRRLCEIVGYTPDELLERTFQSLTHPDDVGDDVAAIRKLVSGEIPTYAREKRYIRKDGGVVWIFLGVTLARNGAGAPEYFVSAFEDISERKRVEQQLVFGNVLLTTQQETSLDGILVVDEDAKILSYNRRFVEMWGIAADIIETRSDDLALKAVVAKLADPQGFIEKVTHLYAHRSESSVDDVPLADGRRFERYSAPMCGADSKYYGRVWYFRDVTERKRLEDALRLTQFSVDTTADAIIWVRQDGSLAYANDAMCRLLGYSREEMLGLRVFDLDAAHTPETWERRWEECGTKRAVQVQTEHRRKDGTSVPVDISSNFIELDGQALFCAFIRDMSERKRTEEELFRLATTDALTEIPNRRYFFERCNDEIERVRRYGGSFSALMLDVDHFKRINDTLGHSAGDEALRTFARVCSSQLRKTDLIGRIGGEEFAVSLPQTSPEGAVVVAERLRAAIERTRVETQGSETRLTVSIGVTSLSADDRSIDDVFRRADAALYEAKRRGRNGVVAQPGEPG
jgi:diguanylate cyclase (GGDEF)-like protein/PAS domain S-box-containing protein